MLFFGRFMVLFFEFNKLVIGRLVRIKMFCILVVWGRYSFCDGKRMFSLLFLFVFISVFIWCYFFGLILGMY